MLARTVTLLIALLFGAGAYAQVAPVSRPSLITPAQTITAGNGMVVAQEQRAARIGIEILDRGGNAVDAAVAVGFALAVTYPRAGNIGGGGFMVIHLSKTGEDAAIDYRETAPAAATEKMFLDANGEPIRKNRATLRCPSACRALSRVWRWRTKNTVPENSRSPN